MYLSGHRFDYRFSITYFCVSQVVGYKNDFITLAVFPVFLTLLGGCFNVTVQEAKTQLPLVVLKKVWGEAVSYICGLKEDYSRLFQGQRAAM